MTGFDLSLPGRILFGRGMAPRAVAAVLAHGPRLLLVRGASCAGVDPLQAELVREGAQITTVVSRGEPDLPQIEAALEDARAARPDCVLAIGGGATLDLGKALAALVPQSRPVLDFLEVVGRGLPLEAAPLPLIALPTTAGTGSEATKNAVIGVPEHRRKVSLRDRRMLPELALVDPALTDGCPAPVTLASGLDAIVQVIEPYISARANPFTDALCREAIPRGLSALKRLMQGEDAQARDEIAYVSLCGGIALANAGLGAVHGLAGVIGGETGMAHGAICGRLLVPVLRENQVAMRAAGLPPDRMDFVLRAIGTAFDRPPEAALDALETWINAQGLPFLTPPGPAGAEAWAEAALASSSMKANPVSLPVARLAAIIEASLG